MQAHLLETRNIQTQTYCNTHENHMYIVQYINFIVYTLVVDSRYILLSTVRVLGTICTTNEFILCGSGSALCMFPLIVMSCLI